MCHEFTECRKCICRGLYTIQRSQLAVKVHDRGITFCEAEGAGEGAFDEEAGVVVSECATLEPSGALMDTLGTSGALTVALPGAEDVAAATGRFLRAPGGT